jgi:putative transposase
MVMRYGDLNPVRAGLARNPKDWKWSSYRHYAYGAPDSLIDDAPDYLALGVTPAGRRRAYRSFFCLPLSSTLGVRRCDLVSAAFIGDRIWIAGRLRAAGRPPPAPS